MPSPAPNTANDENARYRRVIRAAEELFKRLGFRAVTMELVAREADVAKATLYSYFKNKDELYLAVCERMAALMVGAVERALVGPGLSLDHRIAEAVVAKHRLLFNTVRGSAHAAELSAYSHSMAGEVFTKANDDMVDRLAGAMAPDPVLAPGAKQLARALFYGSSDLANRGADTAAMESEVTAFALTHLAGVRALAKAI